MAEEFSKPETMEKALEAMRVRQDLRKDPSEVVIVGVYQNGNKFAGLRVLTLEEAEAYNKNYFRIYIHRKQGGAKEGQWEITKIKHQPSHAEIFIGELLKTKGFVDKRPH